MPEGPKEAVSAGIAAAAMRQMQSNSSGGAASSVVGLPPALDALLPRSALAGSILAGTHSVGQGTALPRRNAWSKDGNN